MQPWGNDVYVLTNSRNAVFKVFKGSHNILNLHTKHGWRCSLINRHNYVHNELHVHVRSFLVVAVEVPLYVIAFGTGHSSS